MNIQWDHLIEARRPNVTVVNKRERECIIIAIAVQDETRVSEKKKENMEIYQNLISGSEILGWYLVEDSRVLWGRKDS